jgi:hypothetical protein
LQRRNRLSIFGVHLAQQEPAITVGLQLKYPQLDLMHLQVMQKMMANLMSSNAVRGPFSANISDLP